MSDQKAKRFTIDEDKTGAKMPDIGELLYAKSGSKSKGSKSEESLDPTVSMDISKARLDEITRQSDVVEAPPKQSSYSVDSSTLDASALQNPGQIELGEFDGSLSIEAGTQAPPQVAAKAEAPIELATQAGTPPKRFAPPATGEVVISTFQKSAPAAGAASGSQKPAVRKSSLSTATGPVLKQCDAATLESHSDVVAYSPGIKVFFERGKTTSVIVFNKSGNGFIAEQVVGQAERANIWRGMEIYEKDLTDLYARLNKFGYSEFSTLGMSGAGNFERIGFRTAFGVERSEFMTFVKVGSGKDMDGIVVVLSTQSIATQIPFFHTALLGEPGQMKKAA